MASDSFGSKRKPSGGPLHGGEPGNLADAIYRDVETAFVTHEVRTAALETLAVGSCVVLEKVIANAPSNSYTVAAPRALRIVDVIVLKEGADAGAEASTVQILKVDAIFQSFDWHCLLE